MRESAIDKARSFSSQKIEQLRCSLASEFSDRDFGVVVVGSYGRLEASPQSDLDFFLVKRDESIDVESAVQSMHKLLSKFDIRQPAKDGAFASHVETCASLTHNIGGFADKNERLTRRLLFLFEGDWILNKSIFDSARESLISHYVRETISEHQLCRFLLNDLIRYYRTICVDFAFKTYEDGKPWGDRNIKLMFSRKLLYFSGILVVAETVQKNYQTKRQILLELLAMSPLQRVQEICGQHCARSIQMYDEFLEQLSTSAVREMLKNTPEERGRQSVQFRELKNNGHHFTAELSRLLECTYDSSHPIHAALRF